jgi:hypothetical protein
MSTTRIVTALALTVVAASDVAAQVAEPRVVAQAIEAAGATNDSSEGPYLELGQMIPGSGWISAGPGYRHLFLNDRAVFDGSAALSWRAYKIAQVKVELDELAHGRLLVGSQAFWQDATQIDYFGVGSATHVDDRAQYRLHTTDIVGYGDLRLTRRLIVNVLGGRLFAASHGSFIHGDAAITMDNRDRASYPQRGGLLRAGWTHYSDRAHGRLSFTRYEAEGVRYVPLISHRWTMAMHGWLVASDAMAAGQVPFFLLPSLGGDNTLRGYVNYRFRDNDTLVLNLESRFAISQHLAAAVFGDAGDVARRLNALDLKKESFGVGIRAHTRAVTVARIDIARSPEGWRVLLKSDDLLSLPRLSRRAASAPFVP